MEFSRRLLKKSTALLYCRSGWSGWPGSSSFKVRIPMSKNSIISILFIYNKIEDGDVKVRQADRENTIISFISYYNKIEDGDVGLDGHPAPPHDAPRAPLPQPARPKRRTKRQENHRT